MRCFVACTPWIVSCLLVVPLACGSEGGSEGEGEGESESESEGVLATCGDGYCEWGVEDCCGKGTYCDDCGYDNCCEYQHVDCGPGCGDGYCSEGKSCDEWECCGATVQKCCGGEEDATSCPGDCGPCTCGDATCVTRGDCCEPESCPEDCVGGEPSC